jgi:hypothetical protein
MKMYQGPFNLNCTTNKDPKSILNEISKALDLYKVSFKKVTIFTLTSLSEWPVWSEMPAEWSQIRDGDQPLGGPRFHFLGQIQTALRRNVGV